MSQPFKRSSRAPAPFATLRRFVRERDPQERCEVCGAGLYEDHQHLLEPSTRQLICVCDRCVISVGQQSGSPYRRVPTRARVLPDFQLIDAQWDGLLIPVGMAFFCHSTAAGRVMAYYPSPAGATESLLALDTWAEIVQANPILQDLEPDVEALLVNRLKGGQEYYLVPIDKCYELVGLIRAYWRGLSGGTVVWDEIGTFFGKLKRRAGDQAGVTRA